MLHVTIYRYTNKYFYIFVFPKLTKNGFNQSSKNMSVSISRSLSLLNIAMNESNNAEVVFDVNHPLESMILVLAAAKYQLALTLAKQEDLINDKVMTESQYNDEKKRLEHAEKQRDVYAAAYMESIKHPIVTLSSSSSPNKDLKTENKSSSKFIGWKLFS